MGFENLRAALARELADASSARIERVLGAELADDLENISGVFQTVGKHVQQVAPGALRGAATGFLVGGPAGALVGASGGGLASSGLVPGLTAPATQAATPASTPHPIANPAALELLLTILRPEVVDALIALALGRAGARAVPIAGTQVPVAAVTNLIQSLSERASLAQHATRARGGIPRYLAEARQRGEDIADMHVRANALLSLVREAWRDDDEAFADDFSEDIDEEAEARDLDDIYRLGGFDP
jgi:hypothetical protein